MCVISSEYVFKPIFTFYKAIQDATSRITLSILTGKKKTNKPPVYHTHNMTVLFCFFHVLPDYLKA